MALYLIIHIISFLFVLSAMFYMHRHYKRLFIEMQNYRQISRDLDERLNYLKNIIDEVMQQIERNKHI